MAASGTGSICLFMMLLLIEAAVWIVTCKVYTLSQMLQNWSDSASQFKWRMKKSNPRVSQGKAVEYSSMAKPVTWSQSQTVCFSIIKYKIEGRKTHKQIATECCSEVWVEQIKGGNPDFWWCPRVLDFSHWLQRIFLQVLKRVFVFILYCVSFTINFEPLKIGDCAQNCNS